jgi:hypothetical protein
VEPPAAGLALARELSLRDVRPRLFLHVLSVSGSKSCPPEVVLNVMRVVRAAAGRSRAALAQLASDVGVRPLAALLALGLVLLGLAAFLQRLQHFFEFGQFLLGVLGAAAVTIEQHRCPDAPQAGQGHPHPMLVVGQPGRGPEGIAREGHVPPQPDDGARRVAGQVAGLEGLAGDGDDEAALRAWMKQRLTTYKMPESYEFMAQLPRDQSGKIRRSQLAREGENLKAAQ